MSAAKPVMTPARRSAARRAGHGRRRRWRSGRPRRRGGALPPHDSRASSRSRLTISLSIASIAVIVAVFSARCTLNSTASPRSMMLAPWNRPAPSREPGLDHWARRRDAGGRGQPAAGRGRGGGGGAGSRAGVATGDGCDSDFGFTAIARRRQGGVAGLCLLSRESHPIAGKFRAVGALVLAAIALQAGWSSWRATVARPPLGRGRQRRRAAGALQALSGDHGGEPAARSRLSRRWPPRLTLDGPASDAAFATGAGAASAGWHLVLTLIAGHAGRWITPPVRRGLDRRSARRVGDRRAPRTGLSIARPPR